MKSVGICLVIAVAVFGFFAAMEGHAATYKYVDKAGNVGLADDLQAIPEQYRKSAVLISGDAKQEVAPPQAPAAPAGPMTGAHPAPPPQSFSAPVQTATPAPQTGHQPVLFLGMPLSTRLAISIGVVIAAIFVSVFLGKISAMHGHDRAIHMLRVSLSWLVMLYLVAAHAKDVITLVKTAGSNVQSVSDASAEKGEKAAKAIKSLEAAMEQAARQAQEHEHAVREAERAVEK
ncbi:MAG TPA: hypothetical protein VN604_04585 [Nitrospirota bacterium]|nr:hypothetical protein [Nitrospirota bacterium]